jgi:DNA-binding transcriptional ArsR family regulator
MVVNQLRKLGDDEIDRIFRALADATRRDIVARVLQREHTVTELAERYAMSFAAVQKHVAVLERAALVRKTRRGREQRVRGDAETVSRASELLQGYERLWHERIDRIDALLNADEATPGAASERTDG